MDYSRPIRAKTWKLKNKNENFLSRRKEEEEEEDEDDDDGGAF